MLKDLHEFKNRQKNSVKSKSVFRFFHFKHVYTWGELDAKAYIAKRDMYYQVLTYSRIYYTIHFNFHLFNIRVVMRFLIYDWNSKSNILSKYRPY